MKTALVPGSFDPITVGHEDIIRRACKMFDRVYVTVFVNAAKTPRFSLEDRLEMVKAVCADYDNVICDVNEGMLADYCAEKGICAAVKGARNAVDFEYEKKMAEYNRKRNPELDTVILFPAVGLEEVSSTKLYTCINEGEDYEKYVPEKARAVLTRILGK